MLYGVVGFRAIGFPTVLYGVVGFRAIGFPTVLYGVVGFRACNGPGVVQRRDRQKKEFHDQSDYR